MTAVRPFVSVFFPDEVFDMCVEVVCPGQDEEVVGEAVDVFEERGADVVFAGERHYEPFGAAAYRAGHMGLGGGDGAAGQDECVRLGDLGVEGVYAFLEVFDVFGGEPGGFGPGVRGRLGGQVCADVEEFVLYVPQLGLHGCGGVGQGEEQPEVAGEFVYGAVCFETDVVFACAYASHEGCGAGVAGAGV